MPEYISAAEAARRYHKADKTIYKWIRIGKLKAEERSIEGLRQFAISTDDIERLLAEDTASIPEHTGVPISSRVDSLEYRVSKIERELHYLYQQTSRIVPQREIAPQYEQPLDPAAHHDLPLGTLHIQDFLARHKLKAYRRRIIGYLDAPKNGLHFFAEQKANRPDETDRYLTPVQQEELLTWLRTWHADLFDDLFNIR